MNSILNLPLSEWPDMIKELGAESYRASQLVEWVFKKKAHHFSEMTTLPADFRKKLEEKFTIHSLHIDHALTSEISN